MVVKVEIPSLHSLVVHHFEFLGVARASPSLGPYSPLPAKHQFSTKQACPSASHYSQQHKYFERSSFCNIQE
jgi:hypothetical protein